MPARRRLRGKAQKRARRARRQRNLEARVEALMDGRSLWEKWWADAGRLTGELYLKRPGYNAVISWEDPKP